MYIYIYIYTYIHGGSNLYNSQVSNESMSPAMSPSHSVLQLGQTRSLEARRLVIERLLGVTVEGAPGLALAISTTMVILGFATLNVSGVGSGQVHVNVTVGARGSLNYRIFWYMIVQYSLL